MTNLDSTLKSRDIHLPTKVCIVKARVFPVVIYGCESWSIEKTQCQRTDVFQVWSWKRLLSVSWTARRSNQSILKEFNSEYPLEGLMLKLKLQYLATCWEERTHWERPWCWETLKAKRRRRQQRMRWLDDITDSRDMGLSKLWEIVRDRKAWCAVFMGLQKTGHNLETEQQNSKNTQPRRGQVSINV